LKFQKAENKVILFARLVLALSFLSAVADRFGLWGASGSANVSWGNFANFLEYTALLNPWTPKVMIPYLGGLATFLELVFAVGLITGFQIRLVALGSGSLLLMFALSMTLATGIKSPLDYSVFSASAAAFLIYSLSKGNSKNEEN